ncbi:StbB family protein [Pseudomonas syringae pv. coryli]|uniref:StbB family protein n=1 Tax=Pseudomonas syringae pv. coryli TaxID=317659 RepID=UPI003D2DFA2E
MTYVMAINFSGNNGKSTISDNTLAPRFEDAEIIRIETINSHEGDDADNLKGKEYGDIIEGMVIFKNAVVDVGSSNVEDVMNLMAQYDGSHEVFDYFVVPAIPRQKQIRDTIRTIERLSEIGVQPEKIRLVFNMVESEDSDLEKDFSALFKYHTAEHKFTLNRDAVIYQNDFYARVSGNTTIEQILADTTDYNEALKNASTPEERIEVSRKRANKFLANGLKVKLDKAFAAIFE